MIKRILLSVLALFAFSADAQWMNWTGTGNKTASSVSSAAFPLQAPPAQWAYSFNDSTSTGLYEWSPGCFALGSGGTAYMGICGSGSSVRINSSVNFGFSSGDPTATSLDTIIVRDAANTLAQKNGTNPQAFRIYSTFTDASNYERIEQGWGAGGIASTQAGWIVTNAGTGAARSMWMGTNGVGNFNIRTGGGDRWQVTGASGHLIALVDNTVDIGASGATRPRNGFFGTGVITPIVRSVQTTAPTCTSNCGTSPTVVGGDTAGIVTMGATGAPASGWVLTFNGTWAAAPSCIVQSALGTMVVGKMPIAVATTTTTMTVTTNGTAPANSDKYAYHCIGVS